MRGLITYFICALIFFLFLHHRAWIKQAHFQPLPLQFLPCSSRIKALKICKSKFLTQNLSLFIVFKYFFFKARCLCLLIFLGLFTCLSQPSLFSLADQNTLWLPHSEPNLLLSRRFRLNLFFFFFATSDKNVSSSLFLCPYYPYIIMPIYYHSVFLYIFLYFMKLFEFCPSFSFIWRSMHVVGSAVKPLQCNWMQCSIKPLKTSHRNKLINCSFVLLGSDVRLLLYPDSLSKLFHFVYLPKEISSASLFFPPFFLFVLNWRYFSLSFSNV